MKQLHLVTGLLPDTRAETCNIKHSDYFVLNPSDQNKLGEAIEIKM